MIVILELGLTKTCAVEATAIKHPEIRLYGFDPKPDTKAQFGALKLNNFILVPKAAWINNEPHLMNVGGKHGAACSLVSNRGATYYPPITVECMDFDEWICSNLKKNDYNVMHCDIEGSEYVVLPYLIEKGSIHYFKEIHVEWHRRKFVGATTCMNTIIAYCEANNIKIFRLNAEVFQLADDLSPV